jgi:two-component system CheB/CheR fusion protein
VLRHETLEQQRTTSNDLQNVLYSTDVATLFLDGELNIRFFTPATKSLFNLIQGDVGRPLADLHSLAADVALASDARDVFQSLTLKEREIQTPDGTWFRRRISPYRTHDNHVEGVVITFNDITKRKLVAEALDIAKQQAEQANAAKSRFLAAASHDLRQPLQTLSLLQGLLAKTADREKSDKLLVRLDDTLGAMSGMLNTLLDINQIEAGIVRAEPVTFQVGEMLHRLRDEFAYHAQAQSLLLRVVPCSLLIHSDPRLLEQMLRNLLSNALKYTRHGKVLLGCRRRAGMLNIEVWDTGVGIPDAELKAIFEEYHQIDNAARERSRGLGLGLSIVQRLGGLLGHQVHVQSCRGKGSVFAIEVALPTADMVPPNQHPTTLAHRSSTQVGQEMGLVLVIEDDPEVRDLLELLLTEEGYRVVAVPDGAAALERVEQESLEPDMILADFNLPGGINGLGITAALREWAHREIPAIILTGDMSTSTSQEIAAHRCRVVNKPVKPDELLRYVEKLLSPSTNEAPSEPGLPIGSAGDREAHVIYVIDDDDGLRRAVRDVLEADGQVVEDYPTGEEFIGAYRPDRKACLLIDANLPGMSGIALIKRLSNAGDPLPAILITGNSDVPMAVRAMKAGASDFIEKPIGAPDLLASIKRALEQARDVSKLVAWRDDATQHIANLTPRQREIMELVLAGRASKNIAADLGISQRTVENHRASLMRKTGTKSLPALARLALAATWKRTEDGADQMNRLAGHSGTLDR